MKKARRMTAIGVLVCLCCLLGGCRESALQTAYTSVCETVENSEQCYAQFSGKAYITVEMSEELTDILNPSCWKRTLFASTATPYCYIKLPNAKLEFYEENLLCITVSETNDQKWYVSKAEVRPQMKQYMEQYGGLVPPLPDLSVYAAYVKKEIL